MPEALDNGSQPYRNTLGCFEMAGKGDTHTHTTLPLGKGHGLTMSPIQGQAILLGGNLIPAIYFPSLREQ